MSHIPQREKAGRGKSPILDQIPIDFFPVLYEVEVSFREIPFNLFLLWGQTDVLNSGYVTVRSWKTYLAILNISFFIDEMREIQATLKSLS